MKVLAISEGTATHKALNRAFAEAVPDAELVACTTAAEALALPEMNTFDVAFVEISPSEIGGLEIVRKLKQLNPRMGIVFAAGVGEDTAYALGMCSPNFLMRPITTESLANVLEGLRLLSVASGGTDTRLFVRCFGEFEVFVNGQAVEFKRTKSKELLAFLVDRRGAVVSMRAVEAALWEEAPRPTRSSGSYLRTLVADLRRTLSECGHDDVLVRRPGQIGVDTTRVSCDYYDYLRGDPSALSRWCGEYMAQYAWAEATRAALLNR